MKKYFFFAAIAAIGLASCSSDETIASQATSESNEISFRPFTTGLTRAADVDLPTKGFYVTALKQGQTPSAENTYFDNIHFTNDGTTYVSGAKYYWPSDYNLDFYAYSPAAASATDVVRSDYKTFVITANATAASQVDFVYANTNDWGKATLQTGTDASHTMGAVNAGVTVNFRHAESKVVVKLKNTNSNVKFTVGEVTIGNLYNKGTFTYASTNTDGSGHLNNSEWGTLRSGEANAYTSVFTQTVTDGSVYSTSTSQQAGVDMILIPQTLVYKGKYTNDDGTDATTSGITYKGAYIKVQLKMQNNNNNAYILGSSSTWVEALWPLTELQWQPGYRYTYEVDLSGGGYAPTNQDTDSDLDPILEGAEIKFVTVTVDGWTDYATNPIPVP